MIVLKVKKPKKDWMSDVTILALEAEIKREYEPEDSKTLISKFHNMMLGSTVSMMDGEMAIYPHGIAAIFSLLKVPVKFVDDKGADMAINVTNSGAKWHCNWYILESCNP
ncbi:MULTISPECIES: hypothetical protein [unclassified Colwellia]|jgi:hypothetical protein|uniref:hypothetical protein n=1 Tax=unclassified Colwellia TaxID=196834 RepID=UPI0015F6FAA9|nr:MULTISPECIES: hypothetical protein [unclassified Colwellia]MBA6357491.1 hypothetical protein [Colwellia sp. BRX8-3]MBA6361833.1 hypothetical protein [Colwellia sp. BRX8-6]MBA6369404.1 hypothetical protein [Colwellia sp. BRX8-5]MBA6376793.1 hypothetical protein [Colwellia sp. BRX8-2]